MLKKIPFLILMGLILLLFQSINAQSQNEKYVPGELIIRLNPNAGTESIESTFSQYGLQPVKQLSRRLNIWLFEFSSRTATDSEVLTNIKSSPSVKLAQFNHYIQRREAYTENDPGKQTFSPDYIPNDPSFSQQWALNNTGQSGGTPDADIDAVEAWDLNYGGPASTGDEIIIAVIDGGVDLNHEDISYWKNTNEIPDNNIDDDNNGFVDDYDGWNAYNSTGDVPSDNHGTHVAGIAAGIGNNGIGISGVNPNAKVLPVAGSTGQESIAVEAYSYVYEMRALYNETNGEKGAFVVVTNASFGVDYGDPADYPIWCDMYDELGTVGVLNCGATANLNINVDVQGDVPTACPSDFMISVTNTTDTDSKNSGAAYGATTIDLGAPGTNIYSAIPGNSYGNKTGTSMATPTVAGAIALMYSAANQSIMQNYKENPEETALFIREQLLSNVDPVAALDGITVTGGRLNIYNALLAVVEEPDDVPPTTVENLSVFEYTSNSLGLTWTAPYDTSRNGVVSYDLRWSDSPINSDSDFENANMIDFPETPSQAGNTEEFTIENLAIGTMYYFAIKSSDIWGNVSALSNSASGSTWEAPSAVVTPASINTSLPQASSTTEIINLANNSSGNSTLDFNIELANNTFPDNKAVNVALKPVNNNVNKSAGTKENPVTNGGVSFRGSGGPDLFGYEWIDSNDPTGPEYEWTDISSTGTIAAFSAISVHDPEDEGMAGPYDLGFNFKFYGETYSEVYIGTNGFISFETFNGNTYSNTTLPNDGEPNNIIAPFWEDLDGTNQGDVYYQQIGSKFIIQYDHWQKFYGTTGYYTFQIVLSSNGKIMFYYEDMNDAVTSATVGIENSNGDDGLQVVQNSQYIENYLAVEFAAEPEWLASDIFSGTIYNNNSVDIELTLSSEDYPEGDYSMDVVISTNDPSHPEIIVPVSLTIGEGGSSENWSADLLISDAEGTKISNTLTFGQNTDGTDGIDASLNEYELPPLPVAGVFDTRFLLPGNIASLTDIRNSEPDSLVWELRFQPGSSGYPVTLSWNSADLPAGEVMLKDPLGGISINVDMHMQSSIEITNENINTLMIEYSGKGVMSTHVNSGWNIVSVPMNMEDMNVTSVFPTASSQAYSYNNGYNAVSETEPGSGYWLKFNNSSNIVFSGEPASGNVQLSEGWNLIGPMAYEMDVNNISTNPVGIIYSSFYSFNNGYTVAETLMPGKGYWVKSTGNGEIVYNTSVKKENTGYATTPNENRIIFTDADGYQSILEFAANSTNVTDELPPLPPAGVPDIRFTSNNRVEAAGVNEISLNSVSYPVTVRVEGTGITITDNFGGQIVNATLEAGNSFVISDQRITTLKVNSTVIPAEFGLSQNYPNPFNPSTTISFALPVDSKVKIVLYNMLGEKVADIISADLSAGSHEADFNASSLSSGMYIYNISASGSDGRNFTDTKKMMLMK